MHTQKTSRAVIAGLVGTALMTALAFMGPLMGLPEMKTGEMLAGFMGVSTTIGWIAHFMIGSILAVIYAELFSHKLPGDPWVRGIVFGVVPWLVLQIMLSPMMGAGFFSLKTPAPVLFLLGSLMGHMAYGAVVGGVYGSRFLATTAAAR